MSCHRTRPYGSKMSEPGIEPGFARPQRAVLTTRRFGRDSAN